MRGAGSINSIFLILLGSTILAACGGGGGGTAAPPQASTVLVDITVLDSANLPVPGATVTITSDPVVTITKSDGQCQVEVEPGSHTITVVKNGNTLVNQQQLNVTDDQSLDLTPDQGILFYNNGMTWYPDEDGDGYSTGNTVLSETPDPGYYLSTDLTSLSGDCDDTNPFIHPFQTEMCNNVDDNCAGGVDENLNRGTTCGVGPCAGNTGQETCTAGVWGSDTCDAFAGATTEICDNIDNNCDGTIDSFTQPTSCGVGACLGNTGVETCTAGTWGGDTCDPVAGANSEVCDNIDNNCDGTVDSFTQQTTCGVGACAGNVGMETCTAGMWGGDTCNPLDGYSTEVCDNIDNDCDGTVDSITQSTICGVGACFGNVGVETCTGGSWGNDTCDPLGGATAEICDNMDNDCDGSIDDTLSRSTSCGVGQCAGNTGSETCTAGTWGDDTCDSYSGATAETCDNVDNNCDGSVDDNLMRNTTCGLGQCAGNMGSETCTAGTWGGDTCNPLAGATAETCDSIDNNCDGTVDFFTRTTTCGIGACSGNGGIETCMTGAWGGDTCDSLTGAGAETCNNVDDDCDGSTDENLTRATTCGVGPCTGNSGSETCTAGSWGGDTCDPLAGATAEICDNIDNDCNGPTDDGNPGGGSSCVTGQAGVCSDGTMTCIAGIHECVADVAGSTETCDGLDNDCDGTTDENAMGSPLTQTCYTGSPSTQGIGECQDGSQTCSSGSFGPCTGEVTPVAEICDGLDNNCDGTPDDGNPSGGLACNTGLPGVCTGGTATCQSGSLICAQTTPASAETCDGLDNNCDGSTDDIGCSAILFIDDDNGINNRAADVGDDPDVDHIFAGDLESMGSSYAFDVHRVMGEFSGGPDLSTLKMYQVVIWATGESYGFNSLNPLTLIAADEQNLSSYLDSGGRLFLSSQDVLWDLNKNQSGSVSNPFATTYLGVVDVNLDDAYAGSTYGVLSDPVSDAFANTPLNGTDAWGYISNVPMASVINSEVGTAHWDTSSNYPGQLHMAATVSSFSSTVFQGSYAITEFNPEILTFGAQTFWSYPDTDETIYNKRWYGWPTSMGANHYYRLKIPRSLNTYEFMEYIGIDYDAYPDVINTGGFPAQTSMLLTDTDGDPIASRVDSSPWKVIFLAFPYEGLNPAAERRTFLKNSIDWLKQ